MAEGQSGTRETPGADVDMVDGDRSEVLSVLARGAVIAVVGGFVGTAVMTLVLVAANAVTEFRFAVFSTLSETVGVPESAFVGFVLFYAAGTFAWPLLFVTIGQFLPGSRDAIRGAFFAFVLWTGFVLAFVPPVSGMALVVYAAATLLAHVAYGTTMGLVFDRYGDHHPDLV